MSIIEIQGDNSNRGILRHWERKTKPECAREILRCWNRITELESQLQAAKERYGQKWISVFDDYPENPKNGDKILGWNGYAFECEYDDGYWGNIGGEEFTYWMPLLEPPATKEQKHEQ